MSSALRQVGNEDELTRVWLATQRLMDKEVARVHFDKRTGRKWLYIHRDGKQVSTGIDVMHIWHKKEDLYALVAELMNEQVNQ